MLPDYGRHSSHVLYPRRLLLLLSMFVISLSCISFCSCLLAPRCYAVDHRLMKHPRFLKNQVSMEIKTSLIAFRKSAESPTGPLFSTLTLLHC